MLAAMSPTADSSPAPGAACARSGGDACPGTLRLHRADDGALARIRIPGGVLTTAQAHRLREAAERLGDGELHLTSRGNVQLRGLADDSGTELAALLGAAGLLPSERHERVRNIVASPLSGLDGPHAAGAQRGSATRPHATGPYAAGAHRISATDPRTTAASRGVADVRPWLTALDALICGSDAATALSGRFLFALDDGRGDVDGLGADVTLIATGPDGALLRIAGHDQAVPVPFADAPAAALTAALAFLDAAGDSGAWRVADLSERARDALPAEVARRTGVTAPTVTRPAPGTAHVPGPGAVTGPGGRTALHVGVPMGRLTAGQWRTLTELCDGELRLTPWRGVVLPLPEAHPAHPPAPSGLPDAPSDSPPRPSGLPDAPSGLPPDPADRTAHALRRLAGAGLVTAPDSPWAGVGACVGRPGCAKAHADVRADAGAAVGPVGRLPVYWSGCERRCGHPHGEWTDVVAGPDGYRITRVRDGQRDAPVVVPHDPAALAAAVAAARSATT
ncbi:cobalamin biosynthesis protein CobG [uncultured Streptomyces sp.]|uniref:cobalamin biosynthesis protein CobG n=1 Tax=uncultured Streptomyces sp. TaxID=174707 RepID=UPI002629794B|nr:cobalamin biosynthesis protein CobG [uncultured Streptomyces sp.]